MPRWIACAAATVLLTLAGGVSRTQAAVVRMSGTTLSIADGRGERNVLDARPIPIFGLRIHDAASPLRAGRGCVALSRWTVDCPLLAVRVEVDAGGGDDLIDLTDLLVPVQVKGGEGDDAIGGGSAGDQLFGGDGVDSLLGSGGSDSVLSGDLGNDFIHGEQGDDTLSGDQGDDVLGGSSDSGADTMLGGDGQDLVEGGPGNDSIQGEAGDDVLVGGRGTNSIGTGTGSDHVFATPGDKVDCRAGDRVQGPDPAACATLPASASVPQAWPSSGDQPPATASTTYVPEASLISEGKARRVWATVKQPKWIPPQFFDVRVDLLRKRRRLGSVCFSHVKSWEHRRTAVPGKARRATRTRPVILFGSRCS